VVSVTVFKLIAFYVCPGRKITVAAYRPCRAYHKKSLPGFRRAGFMLYTVGYYATAGTLIAERTQ
jgi:hypothetical protein